MFFLHLAWHFDLRHEPPSDRYLWVDPVIPEPRLVQVAAVCRLVRRENGKGRIPYGFSPPSDCLDAETGDYLFGPTRVGLTCATFVLAVFHRAGLLLVLYSSWPVNRPGDADWQRFIVEELRNNTPTATPEHVRAVESDIGITVRYRPEEVAGACTVAPIPVSFQKAEEQGQLILARLRNPGQAPRQRKLRQAFRKLLSVLGRWLTNWGDRSSP
jgi:hypothetical protein